VRIPRCYLLTDCSPIDVQFHGFCDTSLQVYAAVLYVRSVYPNGHVEVRIVVSKTGVSPMKRPTIPRLELLGAVLLSRLSATVTEMSDHILDRLHHCDVLDQILEPWKQYINYRAKEIHQLTNKDSWRHCSGLLNPADMPSRGLSGIDLAKSDVWWTGPEFLKLEEKECPLSCDYELNDDIKSELMKQSTEMSHVLLSSLERVGQIQNI